MYCMLESRSREFTWKDETWKDVVHTTNMKHVEMGDLVRSSSQVGYPPPVDQGVW